MQQPKARRAARSHIPSRPGALSLLLQIFKGIFANGMQIPALLCILITAALYHEQFPYHEILAVVLLGSLVLIGLVRGCISWQEQFSEYQRYLAMQRHLEQRGERKPSARRYIPYPYR